MFLLARAVRFFFAEALRIGHLLAERFLFGSAKQAMRHMREDSEDRCVLVDGGRLHGLAPFVLRCRVLYRWFFAVQPGSSKSFGAD